MAKGVSVSRQRHRKNVEEKTASARVSQANRNVDGIKSGEAFNPNDSMSRRLRNQANAVKEVSRRNENYIAGGPDSTRKTGHRSK